MSQFVLMCLILFMGQQYVAGVLDPGYEYVPGADTWLRLHIVPASWQDARRRCQLEGGLLASPSSDALTKAMLSTMTAHKVSRQVFTGMHALITPTDFMSLDGVPLSEIHLNWAQGEPDDVNDDGNCLVLTSAGEVANIGCANAYPYFCRKQNATYVDNSECGTTSVGYQYFERTGSCYKFHRRATTWRDAARVCHVEGGHLAIINSEAEAELMKDIFKKNPVDVVVGAIHDDVAHVGFWKWEDNHNGDWMTLHGQTLPEAGFNQWGKGQPNNYNGTQFYGSIQRSGLFDDLTRWDKDPFICEISP